MLIGLRRSVSVTLCDGPRTLHSLRGVLRGELRSTRAPELLTRVPGAIVMNMALLGDGPLSEDQIIGLVDQIMLPALTGTANE